MTYLNLIMVTSLIFSAAIAMDPPMQAPIKRQYPLDFQPMCFADDKDDSLIIEPNPISITMVTPTFEGIAIKDLEMVLESAPDDAKWIVKDLINKYIPDDCFSSASFLIGNHGIGKTVLAKAIAYKVCSASNWSYEYISSREFMGEYRNQTGVCLRSYLKQIVARKQPIILIIDQLNKILEYTNCSSDDTAFASSLICNFLDDQKCNKNIFFIGIMDRGTKIDQRLKSRMLLHCIRMDEPINPELKRIIFTSKLINDCTKLHPEVTHEWLTQFLENALVITGRNFRCLAIHLKEMLEAQEVSEKKCILEEETTFITQSNLRLALESYVAAQKHLFHIDPYENYVDRTEFQHQIALLMIQVQNAMIQMKNIQEQMQNIQAQRQNRDVEWEELIGQINKPDEEQEEDNERFCIIC